MRRSSRGTVWISRHERAGSDRHLHPFAVCRTGANCVDRCDRKEHLELYLQEGEHVTLAWEGMNTSTSNPAARQSLEHKLALCAQYCARRPNGDIASPIWI